MLYQRPALPIGRRRRYMLQAFPCLSCLLCKLSFHRCVCIGKVQSYRQRPNVFQWKFFPKRDGGIKLCCTKKAIFPRSNIPHIESRYFCPLQYNETEDTPPPTRGHKRGLLSFISRFLRSQCFTLGNSVTREDCSENHRFMNSISLLSRPRDRVLGPTPAGRSVGAYAWPH